MSPLRMRTRRRARSTSVLLLAVGAMAGLALGAMLSHRAGGLEGIINRGRALRKARQRDERYDAIDEGSDMTFGDNDADLDEPELEHPSGSASPALADETTTANFTTTSAFESIGPEVTELEERVLEAFHNDPMLKERAIDIGAIGIGVIELTGWVQASWEISHAVTLARGVPGVTTVVDRLAVRDGERRRDHSGRRYAGDLAHDTIEAQAPRPRAD